MKHLPQWAFALFALSVPASVHAAERSYSITDFERIRVSGPFKVNVVTDRMTRVRGSGSTEALDRVRLEVQGRTLFIRTDRSNFGGTDSKEAPATITIRAPALREASLAGSGSLTLNGMKGLRVGLVVEGSGTLTAVNIQADRLDVGVIGTGTLAMSGTARGATVTARGAATVTAAELGTDDLSVNWESAGDGTFAATRTARVTSVGMGNVVVTGKAACTVSNGGNGQVRCGK